MDKIQISAYKRKSINDCAKSINIDSTTIFLSILGLLLGRAVIIDNLGPFGVAYFIYMCKHKQYRIPVFFSIGIGIILSHEASFALKYILTILIAYSLSFFLKGDKTMKTASIGFIISTLVSVAYSAIKGIYIYDVMMALFEGLTVFVLIYIYSYGMPLILKRYNRRAISSEEIIALTIILGLSISGISNISMFDMSLKKVLSILIILIFSYKCGAALGASIGITIGLITSMDSISSPLYIGIYGFSGLLGGVFNKASKYMVLFGFAMAWSIVTIYTNGTQELILSLREIALSGIIFFLIPDEKLKNLDKFIKGPLGNEETSNNYIKRNREILSSRLKDLYYAYSEIGTTFEKIREKDKVLDERDIAGVIDMINNDVCKNCGMRRSCWNIKFNNTHKMFMEILSELEESGKIDEKNLPRDFEKYCIKTDSIIKSSNHYFDLFMLDYNWNKKFSETRKLISNQIKSLSSSIEDLSNEIKEEINFDIEMENNILVELDKENIKVDNVSFIKRANDDFEINIEKSPCYGGSFCDEKLIPIVSKVVGKTLSSHKLGCKTISDKCNIRLVKAQEYIARSEVASISKDGGIISGDSYTHMEVLDGKYMVAISDGMGKGKKAFEQSSITISLLEKLMESKIDEETAIDTINTMLMLKSSDEIFSTIDLSLIDLRNGKLESIKMGACPTFIKRAKGNLEIISSSSLPVGIVSEINIERDYRHVKEGDFIIMISDGILDAGKDKNLGENWLYRIIEKLDNTNPSEIARLILQESLDILDGITADDMTVVVTKIWKSK